MVNSVLINPNDLTSVLLRLSAAVLIGGLVGWTRQRSGKAAGLRTHMLVTMTAAILVLIPAQIKSAQPEASISYVLQGISNGVGFLGAGVILRSSDVESRQLKIKGLTSASEIWVSAALGACAGCGLWLISLMGTVLMLLVLVVAKRLERLIVVGEGDDL